MSGGLAERSRWLPLDPHLSTEGYEALLADMIRRRIQYEVTRFWQNHVSDKEFTNLASGKEIGHRIADYVEEKTCEVLESHFPTGYQHKKNGERMSRGMGDIWIYSSGIHNPVNIKSGEIGKNGQPNMVSLKKVLTAILNRQIDSYYILIVKFDVVNPDASVYLVDLLDYLDYTHFDSGPGQLMLKERFFYEAMAKNIFPPDLSILEKTEKLMGILEEADERLRRNRDQARMHLQERVYDFGLRGSVTQEGLLVW